MTMQFQINEKNYRATKLSAFDQFHVVRRIAPVLVKATNEGAIAKVVAAFREEDARETGKAMEVFTEILRPLLVALGEMSDEDSDFVINTCLSKVSVEVGGNAWQIVLSNGRLMFEDMDVVTMMRIVFEVLKGQLGSFFLDAASKSQQQAVHH